MATVLTEPTGVAAEEMVHFSIPILKWEEDSDGDLVVKGIATDGTVDSDSQIVDPAWSADALSKWLATGGNVRMSHDPHRPVGKGLNVEVNRDGSGKHWVTSVVVDPLAQKLVRKGVLTAYSVGIARPVIQHDPTGKARGGIITGGELAELSLVDRPSNKSSYLELAKSAANGECEFTGKMVGTDELQKMLDEPAAQKDISSWNDDEALFSFSPKDMANLVKNKIVEQHYAELARKAGELAEEKTPEVVKAPEVVTDEVVPDLAKGPATMGCEGDAASASPGKKLANPASLDADGDCDGDGIVTDGIPKAAKPAKKPKKGKKLPPWVNQPDDSSEKGFPDPKTASGAEEAADMDSAPLPGLMESPAPAHMKAQAASLRYKTVGIDSDMGALHDMTCPAFSPEDVASYHPFADFSTLINETIWQKKALAAATGRDMEAAINAQKAWQAAAILKSADLAELNAHRLEAYKAFRDANPGPASFPSPGTICAAQFNRPVMTAGLSQNGPGYGSPNSAPQVATSAPSAGNFSRPPLGSMQQTPSPSFMKNDFPYPAEPGVPTRVSYPEIEKDKARRALSMMHDHLSHQFPAICPIVDQDAYRVEQPVMLPQIAGLGKTIEPEEQAEVLSDVYKYIRKLEKRVLAGELTEQQARDKLSKRTAEKYARDLARDVQKGMTSIDEVRKALGIEVEMPAPAQLQQLTVSAVNEPESITKGVTPEVMKTMMSEILEPFQAQIAAQTEKITEYQQALAAQQETIDVYGKRFEALASTADPTTNAFTGLALRKAASASVVHKQAEVSDQVNGMMMRQLERTWRTSENPSEREAAYSALNKMKNTFE